MGVKISHSFLSEALVRVLPFCSSDEARLVLECVYFEGNQEAQTMTVTAANGYIMGNVEIPAVVDGPFAKAFHGEALKGFAAARSKFDVLVDFEDSMKNEYLWEGRNYPDYRQIIPSKGFIVDTPVSFSLRAAFMRLKDIYKWSRKSINWNPEGSAVCWSITQKGHVLEMNYEQGNVSFEVKDKVVIDSKPAFVGVNINWVCQILNAAKDLDDLRVGVVASNIGIVFSSVKGKARWVLMPMHVGDYAFREVR
jgi:hypothetical protein